ncbi:hypothetical protein BpHYR1_029787 [Brachionus plicatilis]|uniref:SWIM-type domain-containing protein n=1 Tax=Brachionus plicatilis TaxID=10195 RepID=A0A3M7RBP7_BRAPC|nr:hypothetical protein BpHYR1_029787 [Brachionus plicatilis]
MDGSCRWNIKNKICKHLIGISKILNIPGCEIPLSAKNVPIGEKRKSGRPANAKQALIVQNKIVLCLEEYRESFESRYFENPISLCDCSLVKTMRILKKSKDLCLLGSIAANNHLIIYFISNKVSRMEKSKPINRQQNQDNFLF